MLTAEAARRRGRAESDRSPPGRPPRLQHAPMSGGCCSIEGARGRERENTAAGVRYGAGVDTADGKSLSKLPGAAVKTHCHGAAMTKALSGKGTDGAAPVRPARESGALRSSRSSCEERRVRCTPPRPPPRPPHTHITAATTTRPTQHHPLDPVDREAPASATWPAAAPAGWPRPTAGRNDRHNADERTRGRDKPSRQHAQSENMRNAEAGKAAYLAVHRSSCAQKLCMECGGKYSCVHTRSTAAPSWSGSDAAAAQASRRASTEAWGPRQQHEPR